MPEDRDVVAVWQEEQRQLCAGCGTAEWEWDNPDAWHADHVYCPFCRERAAHRKKITLTPSADDHAGLVVRLYKLPREDD